MVSSPSGLGEPQQWVGESQELGHRDTSGRLHSLALPQSRPAPSQLFPTSLMLHNSTSLELQGKCEANRENLHILQET